MADQMSVALRNAMIAAIESTGGTSASVEIRSGAQPASCSATRTGTILATINLPSDWLSAASSGAVSLLGTWQDASADNSGTAAHFCLYTSQSTKDGTTCFYQGAVSTSGATLNLDSVSFTAGQAFSITSFSFTMGGA